MTHSNTLKENKKQNLWLSVCTNSSHLSPKLIEDIIWAPKRSTMMELPSSRENPISTQGKKGAWKLSRPKKFIRTLGFRLLQMYTSMMVKAWPRNTRLTKVPNICKRVKNLTKPTDCKKTPQYLAYTSKTVTVFALVFRYYFNKLLNKS